MPSTAEPRDDEPSERIARFLPGDPPPYARGARGAQVLAHVVEAVRGTPPTPVVEVEAVVAGVPRRIALKLEGRSRWGSIKGRTALALLGSVAGRIGPGSGIVESTSGNLGVALAGICREVGLGFTAVVDSRLPPAMRERMAAYGASIVSAEGDAPDDSMHLLRRLAKVREILAADPDAVWTNQYENSANVAVHRWWTGRELERQMAPDTQVLLSPVSTGGSFAGMRECLAGTRPAVECVAVDVAGSTIFGGAPGKRLLTGIGAGKNSVFLDASGHPSHVMVTDTDAIAACRALADDLGIAVGGSSGATIAGCLRLMAGRPELTRAMCVCPDLGSNYQQTLYDDGWLLEHGAAEALGRPADDGGRKIAFAFATRTTDEEDDR